MAATPSDNSGQKENVGSSAGIEHTTMITNRKGQESPLILKKYISHISNALGSGAKFQIFFGATFYILVHIPVWIHYDLFYWPPFFIFTLKNFLFWSITGILLIILGIGTFIFSKIYSRNLNYESKKVQKIAKILAFLELFFIPFGTIFGSIVLKELRSEGLSINNTSVSMENAEDLVKKEFSKLLITSGIFHEAIFVIMYLLTIYSSALMLDLSYPFFTIYTIMQMRYILFTFVAIFLCLIGYGYYYSKLYSNIAFQRLGYILAILQMFLVPMGTYVGIIMIRRILRENKEK